MTGCRCIDELECVLFLASSVHKPEMVVVNHPKEAGIILVDRITDNIDYFLSIVFHDESLKVAQLQLSVRITQSDSSSFVRQAVGLV